MQKFILISAFVLSGCTTTLGEFIPNSFRNNLVVTETQLITAVQYMDYGELTHRTELREFTGVDPVRTEWCAAFVNAVLNESGIAGSESVSENPLLARSFLDWGVSVSNPQPGDLVIFPRGNQGWQGHVGFYISTVNIDGVEYYQILGGNQNNRVSLELYPARSVLGIRRNVV